MPNCEKKVAQEKIIDPFGRDIPRFPGYFDPRTNQEVPAESRVLGIPTARTTVLYQRTEFDELRQSFFSLGLEKPREVYTGYFDMDALRSEIEELNRLREKAEKWAKFISPKVKNKAQLRRITGLQEEMQQAWRVDRTLDKQVETASSIGTGTMVTVLRLGSKALYYDLLSRIQDFDNKLGYTHQNDYFDLKKKVDCGMVLEKINGVNLMDFIDERTSVKPSDLDSFRFLIEAVLTRQYRDYDHVLKDGQSEFYKYYPNAAKNLLALATASVTAIIDVPVWAVDGSITQEVKRKNKTILEVIKWTKKFINRVKEVGKSANNTLLNPNSPEFKPLSQEIQGYMCQDRFAELMIMDILGMKDPANAKKLYRRSRELAQVYPEHTAFYTDLADAIRDFQIEIPTGYGILTADNIPSLIDLEKVKDEPEVKLQEIGTLVNQLHPSAYKETFLIDPNDMTLISLIKPTQISFSFDRDRPRSFKIKIIFQNIEGETTIIKPEYIIQKGDQQFELNFLEKSSEIPEMYKVALSATKSILENIKQQVDERRVGVVKATPKPIKESVPLIKIDGTRPAEEVRTKVKTRPEKPVEIQEPELEIEDVIIEPKKSKLVIDELSQRRIEKQLKRVSSEDRNNILEAMERFNNGESVRFYPLDLRGPNGEILFSLRAKATVSGGSRILVTPIKGTPNFFVLAAGYRKDIYRNWGIE